MQRHAESACAVQDTFDDSGRRVRKARVKANDKIAAHAEWVTNNPYRMPQAGQPLEVDDDGAGSADEDAVEVTEANGVQASGGGVAAGGSGSAVAGEDDEDARPLSDGAHVTSHAPAWQD